MRAGNFRPYFPTGTIIIIAYSPLKIVQKDVPTPRLRAVKAVPAQLEQGGDLVTALESSIDAFSTSTTVALRMYTLALHLAVALQLRIVHPFLRPIRRIVCEARETVRARSFGRPRTIHGSNTQ